MSDRSGFYNSHIEVFERAAGRYYHRLLERYFSFLIPPKSRVLEIGCGLGDLLAAVRPSRGLGIDFSEEIVRRAGLRHPALEFLVAEASRWKSTEKFEYVIVSDFINDIPDVQAILARLHENVDTGSRVVLNLFNNLWRPILGFAELVGLKAPTLPQNWLSKADVCNLLHLTGWEMVKSEAKILWPMRSPPFESMLNRWVAPLPFFRHLCLTIFLVARPEAKASFRREYSCSVVIPARNESGNIQALVQRIPEMGKATELLFIEGHSMDNTWEELERVIAAYPERQIRLLKQRSRGKGGAVREAFAEASGDLLLILDADLTMPPEQLPSFYEVACSGKADFVNGVRLVYPMQHQAMRFWNMVGNKFFSLVFSYLLGQSIKDTLCGTKVLFKKDYEAISRNRTYFGDFDPFGDFDLLFGAAKLNLRILDLPIRYQSRRYGETNIQRWRHGWLLLRMVMFAAKRIKFI